MFRRICCIGLTWRVHFGIRAVNPLIALFAMVIYGVCIMIVCGARRVVRGRHVHLEYPRSWEPVISELEGEFDSIYLVACQDVLGYSLKVGDVAHGLCVRYCLP